MNKQRTVLIRIEQLIFFILLLLQVIPSGSFGQPSFSSRKVDFEWPIIRIWGWVYCNNQYWRGMPTLSNFLIKENGKEVQITDFGYPDLFQRCCTSTALVFDRNPRMSEGSSPAFIQAKKAAQQFVKALDGNCDESIIISTDMKPSIDVFMTNDILLLSQTITDLQPGTEFRLFDALWEGINQIMENGTQECRAVIIFTNGIDIQSTKSIVDVINAAVRSRLRLFPLAFGSNVNKANLQRLAVETGGKYFGNPDSSTISRLYEEISWSFKHEDWFDGGYFLYQSQCADGSKRTVEIMLRDIPDCPGTSSKTVSITVPVDSSIVHRFIIEEKILTQAQEVSVGMRTVKPLNMTLDPFSFSLRFDTSCVKFLGIDTAGTLLHNVALQWSWMNGGIVVHVPEKKIIDQAGLLIKFKFQIQISQEEKECPLTLTDWTFKPECFIPVLQSGRITILGSPTGVDKSQTPTAFVLEQNYPNPFSTSTTIRLVIRDWRLESTAHNTLIPNPRSLISFKVFDLFGCEVLDLSDEARNNSQLGILNSQLPAPGIYFYRLTVGAQSQTKMMVSVK